MKPGQPVTTERVRSATSEALDEDASSLAADHASANSSLLAIRHAPSAPSR
jgi:hypothetical protein